MLNLDDPAACDRLVDILAARMPPARFLHVLGVTLTAVQLAPRMGVDVRKAWLAALLHDYAKSLGPDELCTVLEAHGWPLTDEDRRFPHILHAPAGAVLVRAELGVRDDEILDAIAHHPAGRANPSHLLMVLMAADFTEPTRAFPGVEEHRIAVRESLPAALLTILKAKAAHIERKGQPVHSLLWNCVASLEEMVNA